MIPIPHRMALCTTVTVSLFLAAAAAAQSTATERIAGEATVSTSEITGEVVQVEGNDLVVRLSSGEMRTFRVPETRTFLIDGKDLTVRDLQPGTTLTATVQTTTTPVTVRTTSVQGGRVWYVAPPTVILTLPTGENRQYVVDDDVQFVVNGRPATVFDLRKDMTVSVERIVEEPDVQIATATAVVGQAPTAARVAELAQAAAEQATAASAELAQAAEQATAPVGPATVPPGETTEPGTGGTMSPLRWAGLLALVIGAVWFFVIRKKE